MKVYVKTSDKLHIKVLSDDIKYNKAYHNYFKYYLDNYWYMPKFQSGKWDGKISLIKSGNRLPYGLFTNWWEFHKINYPHIKPIISDNISYFTGKNEKKFKIKYDLKFTPYSYQKEAIKLGLKYKKVLIRSCTASGKSLIITYICKTLNEQDNNIKQQIIIVPSIDLVNQFKNDMIDYGIKENKIGQVYNKKKEFDKEYVISTWQSLKNHENKLYKYQSIILDECHQSNAYHISKILQKSPAQYRIGLTGTLPSDELRKLQIKSYIGPVIVDYSLKYLMDLKYIANCKINRIILKYLNPDEFGTELLEIKKKLFNNKFRNNIIKNIIKKLNDNILLLVNNINIEGEILYNLLSNDIYFKNKEIVFLSGRDSENKRKKWIEKCKHNNNIIIIATYGIFAQGINIKSLKYLILSSSTKSEIRLLQSIGRVLRKHENKKHGAIIFDISDDVKLLNDHYNERLHFYIQENLNINNKTIYEKL